MDEEKMKWFLKPSCDLSHKRTEREREKEQYGFYRNTCIFVDEDVATWKIAGFHGRGKNE